MIDFIIGTFAFIGLSTVVFAIIIWACAYWATSSTFIGCQKTKGDNDESTIRKSQVKTNP